jgi:exodeoxyribonuclease V beta subunit
MIAFDPAGPLPTGTVLLEASAGTGKTHAIAALAARYLAEGRVEADRLAVISFSRIASVELRSRVRQRLLATRDLLSAAHRGQLPSELDETDALLVEGEHEVLLDRHSRLVKALATLDGAAIMTIHEFCQAMMAELGVLAEADPQATLVEDVGILLDQLTDDLYLQRYGAAEDGPPFDLPTARALAREAIELVEARLVPADARGAAAERLRFAHEIRLGLAERKRRLGVYSFDDQLLRLRDSLGHATSQAAVERLRRRCQVVLVDEFQDTDPVQWSILRQAFDGYRPLVLIGDPKQAIYGFRGADVTAYQQAVGTAAERYSLTVNHRADPAVVSATNALFGGVTLGEGIEVPQVEAARDSSRLLGEAAAPARIRCIAPQDPLDAASARAWITADLVAEVVRLLSGGTRLDASEGPRDLRAADIAVLVSTNRRGRELAEALTAAGVAVAFSGSDSVFSSAAADDWLTLLRALVEPRRQHVRAAILTDFLGGDLSQVATATDAQLADWGAVLQNWSRLLERDDVAGLFAAVQQQSNLVERVLAQPFGERRVTDYRHLAELLHARYSAGQRGQALVGWLAETIAAVEQAADRTRRLETDRRAVQIMTVHKAKGLQFPIVLVPQAADLHLGDDEGGKLVYHADDGERVLDLGGVGTSGRADRLRKHDLEAAADRLRSLYVAVTRAQSQVTLWWARTKRNTEASPLHRLLFCDHRGTPAPAYPTDRHPGELDWLGRAGVAVEDCPPPSAARLRSAPDTATRLMAPRWERQIDQLWRRTSYSGLTAAVHARGPVGLAEPPLLEDEPTQEAPAAAVAAGPPSPMADLPGGTAFGSLVHHILENLNWYAPRSSDEPALRERLHSATASALTRYPLAGVDTEQLSAALLPSLLTGLGWLTDGRSLAQLPITDRLSELDFEYPLGHATSTTTLGEVARLLRGWLPPQDPLAGYPDELQRPGLAEQVLRGYLTGSIDSVLRVPGEAGPRFLVVDYKTNRLGGQPELLLEHYRPEAMAQEMIRSHYPLQALVYCVALHRFLSGRLPGYEPERHLGGVGYLFVRGMAGRPPAGSSSAEPETGVFSWRPPAGLVVELSELIADRSAR